jgi:hypothetical protein
MKQKIIVLLVFCSSLTNFCGTNASAQSCAGIPIQFIAKSAFGDIHRNSLLSLRFSFTGDSLTDNVIEYSEFQTIESDSLGIVRALVGCGLAQVGHFNQVDWSNSNKYIKIEFLQDDSFILLQEFPILSVPFALHALNQPTGSIGSRGVRGPSGMIGARGKNGFGFHHYIGEHFAGGVIFHLWRDKDGLEHGLVISLNDLASAIAWRDWQEWEYWQENLDVIPDILSNRNGFNNTETIVSLSTLPNAAQLCYNYENAGFSDWYLPSIQELWMLWLNNGEVSKSLNSIPGASELSHYQPYWSSTGNTYWAAYFLAGYGLSLFADTSWGFYVRAIRKF